MTVEDKRFIKKVIVVCLVVIALIATIHILDKPKVEYWEIYTAQNSDTLWDIAKEHNPHYEGDLREVMHCIKKANGMKTDTVYVGHVYEVPVME